MRQIFSKMKSVILVLLGERWLELCALATYSSMLSRLQCVLIGPVHSYLHCVLKTCSAKDQTNCQDIFLSRPVYKR